MPTPTLVSLPICVESLKTNMELFYPKRSAKHDEVCWSPYSESADHHKATVRYYFSIVLCRSSPETSELKGRTQV